MFKTSMFEFQIVGKNDIGFATSFDLKTSADQLKLFIPYYHDSLDSDFLEISVDGENVRGRFGQMIYDKNGNIRLYFVTDLETDEAPTPNNNVEEYNLKNVVVAQEKRINKIVDILKEKGLIDEVQAKSLASYFTISKNQPDMGKEVPNLPLYLKETHNTLDEESAYFNLHD